MIRVVAAGVVLAMVSCEPRNRPAAEHSRAAASEMIAIAAGPFIAGSSAEKRERAYADYEKSAGHNDARDGGWFDAEPARQIAQGGAFRIDRTPVTMIAYAEFVAATGRTPPSIDRQKWREQNLAQDYQKHVVRYNWAAPAPPRGRSLQPVVLVTHDDATDYCRWRGRLVGQPTRLPTALEFERAARGTDGRDYPWGDGYDPSRLNSVVAGPGDLVDVGSHPSGASPEGVLGLAGNVFQWTSTPWHAGGNHFTVKGSAWEDFAGLGRGASAHGRPADIRHVIVGFRCAR